jgi:hypothetical protein
MALTYLGQTITGLSSDQKPMNVPYGMMFLETDTGNISWRKVSGWLTLPPGGGGGGSDPSYTPGSFTVATGTGRLIIKRMQLLTTERATVTGTARLRIA